MFTIDTGRLFPETYESDRSACSIATGATTSHLLSEIRGRRGLGRARTGSTAFATAWSSAAAAARSARSSRSGAPSSGRRAWVTGIRRGQSASRALAAPVEWDGEYGLHKVSPLLDWSESDDLELHPQEAAALQYAARPRLSEHRLRAVHPRGAAGRGCALGPLVVGARRLARVRSAPAAQDSGVPRTHRLEVFSRSSSISRARRCSSSAAARWRCARWRCSSVRGARSRWSHRRSHPRARAARRRRHDERLRPRIRSGRSWTVRAGHRRDLASRDQPLDRQIERRARHSRERGRRSRGIALHRSGHHRSRSGARGGVDRRHLAGTGAPPARTARNVGADKNRRIRRVAAELRRSAADDGCATSTRGANSSRQLIDGPAARALSRATCTARGASRINCSRRTPPLRTRPAR